MCRIAHQMYQLRPIWLLQHRRKKLRARSLSPSWRLTRLVLSQPPSTEPFAWTVSPTPTHDTNLGTEAVTYADDMAEPARPNPEDVIPVHINCATITSRTDSSISEPVATIKWGFPGDIRQRMYMTENNEPVMLKEGHYHEIPDDAKVVVTWLYQPSGTL